MGYAAQLDHTKQHRPVGGGIRRGFLALALLITTVVAVPTIAASPAAAADGLNIAADYHYRLGDDGVLRVTATFTVRNTTPNRRSGYTITSYYYDAFGIPLPDEIAEMTVNSAGRELAFEIKTDIDDGTEFSFAEIRFGRRLQYQQSMTITVDYQIVGSAPRTDSFDRINPAYAPFAGWGFADEGQLDLTIELPAGYDVENVGDAMQRKSDDTGTVLTASEVADPLDFSAVIIARNDDALVSEVVSTDAFELEVRAWPGDDEWLKFATSTVEIGIPALEDLTGSSWPEDSDFDIIQSAEPNYHGYAGWYDSELGQIVVDERLDVATMLHELSHAWFNGDTLVDRWLIEGFAEEFSRLASDDLDQTPSRRIPPSNNETRRLNTWDRSARTDETETWGYQTSGWVMKQLTDEIGADALRDLVVALSDRSAVYPNESGNGTTSLDADWRRVFDILDRRLGSETADELFRSWVVTKSQLALLDERAEAVALLDELAEAGGDWFVPKVIRERAEAWNFASIAPLVESATETLALRDELDERSVAAGVRSHQIGEERYENASIAFAGVTRDLSIRLNGIAAVEAADARHAAFEPDWIESIGLWGRDVDADLANVRDAYDADDMALVAGESVDLAAVISQAEADGTFRLTLAGLGAALLLLWSTMLIIWRRRARRRRRRTPVLNADNRHIDENQHSDSEVDGVTSAGGD